MELSKLQAYKLLPSALRVFEIQETHKTTSTAAFLQKQSLTVSLQSSCSKQLSEKSLRTDYKCTLKGLCLYVLPRMLESLVLLRSFQIVKSSCSQTFFKIGVFKNFANSQENAYARASFSIKLPASGKLNQVASEFCKISKNTFFIEHV